MRLALWRLFCLGGSLCAFHGVCDADDNMRRTENYLSSKPDLAICATYHLTPTEGLRDDLVRRKVLTPLDWDVLGGRSKLRPGISECGVLAFYGMPSVVLRFAEIAPVARDRFDPAVVGDYDVLYIFVGADGIDPIDIFIKDGSATRIAIELE
jgi:hypothetical protein